MARPLEFEYVVKSEDPRSDYERLLSAHASEAARETLREAEKLDMSLLRAPQAQERPELR